MIDGTYGFVYSGLNGLGFGVFTILGEKFEGVDFVGNRYTGTAREQHHGTISISIDFDVKPGIALVQGTAAQQLPYRRHIEHEMPAGFGNGRPVEMPVPPGSLTVMSSGFPTIGRGRCRKVSLYQLVPHVSLRGPQGKAGQMTISDENRARFEGLGTAEVRHELGVGYVRHLSGEQRVQAQDWLAQQDASFKDATIEARRRETRQFILGIIVGALGALGIVAAWLVIKVWLR